MPSPLIRTYFLYADRAAPKILERRLAEGREDADRIGERRGEAGLPRPYGTLFWFHAASVGEALSTQDLVRQLGADNPGLRFLITTGTRASAQLLDGRLPDNASHQYAPLDSGPFVRRFLDHWKPDLAVWTESEFWPRLMTETANRGIPMLLVNARMSEKSFARWRWLPGGAGPLLRRFDRVLVQDHRSAGYLRRLGLPRSRMEVSGTLKEGASAPSCDPAEFERIAGLIPRRPVWCAASTHGGEEMTVGQAHRAAAREVPGLFLIVAPRHPERGDEVTELLRRDGWAVAQRSKNESINDSVQVYVADTLGEMGLWFRLAPVSFMGGSLERIGGHNPFEPAALGSAILFGPEVKNFADIYDRLDGAGAARKVNGGEELAAALVELQDPRKVAAMARSAREVCSSGGDAVKRAKDVILEIMESGER